MCWNITCSCHNSVKHSISFVVIAHLVFTFAIVSDAMMKLIFHQRQLFDKPNERNIHSRPFDSDIHAVNLARGICESNIFFVRKKKHISLWCVASMGLNEVSVSSSERDFCCSSCRILSVYLVGASSLLLLLYSDMMMCVRRKQEQIFMFAFLATTFLAEFDRVCK